MSGPGRLVSLILIGAALLCAPTAAADDSVHGKGAVLIPVLSFKKPTANERLVSNMNPLTLTIIVTPSSTATFNDTLHVSGNCTDDDGGSLFRWSMPDAVPVCPVGATYCTPDLAAITVEGLSVDQSILHRCRAQNLWVRVRLLSITNKEETSIERSFDVNTLGLSLVYVLCSSVSVIAAFGLGYLYVRHPILRQFPSNIVFWRTLVDLIFSIQFLVVNSFSLPEYLVSGIGCTFWLGFLTQFCILASLNWYFVLAVNFYFSISNPFKRPQSKMLTYHIVVWSTSILTGFITMSRYGFRQDFQLCWNAKQEGINPLNWLSYFAWLFIFASLSLAILAYGRYKLKDASLEATLSTRRETLRQTRIYVVVFTLYWAVATAMWSAVYFTAKDTDLVQNQGLSYFFAMAAGLMGTVDVGTWVYIQWEKLKFVLKNRGAAGGAGAGAGGPSDENRSFDDISDALRHEFILYTNLGIEQACKVHVRHLQLRSMSAGHRDKDDSLEQAFLPPTVSVSPYEDYQTLSIKAKGASIPFTTFRAALFARLRRIFGVSTDEAFAQSVLGDPKKMKKNFSEGASGSFFYFTVDQVYMIKTLTYDEHRFLLEILPQYTDYMERNPRSLICRFFGMYAIRLYGHTEYVVVMNNVLRVPGGLHKIDEIYDLKGSRINRHGKPKKNKKISVFKDLDLKKTIRIGSKAASEVIEQLERDSVFMRDQGIMDYSLLVGIHSCTELRTPNVHCSGLELAEMSSQALHSRSQSVASPSIGVAARSPGQSAASSAAASPAMGGPGSAGGAGVAVGSVVPGSVSLSISPSSLAAGAGVGAGAHDSAFAASRGPAGGAGERKETKSGEDEVKQEAAAGLDDEEVRTMSIISPMNSLRGANPYPDGIQAAVIVGPGVYYLGLIDVLQRWNYEKKAEQWAKILGRCHCFTWRDISAVEPHYYSARFVDMARRLFE